MKKIWLPFLIVVLIISYVDAGHVHSLDFSDEDVQILTMAERDIAAFKFPVRVYYTPYIVDGREQLDWVEKEGEQAFMLRSVKEKQQDGSTLKVADVTVFIEDAETPQYASLTKKTVLTLDFELDRVPDMQINVLDFDEHSNNVTFEFVVLDKTNAKYKPTYYVNKTNGYDGGKSGEGAGSNFVWGYIKSYANNAIDKIYINWKFSIGVVVVLLIVLWNKRSIERFFRRTF